MCVCSQPCLLKKNVKKIEFFKITRIFYLHFFAHKHTRWLLNHPLFLGSFFDIFFKTKDKLSKSVGHFFSSTCPHFPASSKKLHIPENRVDAFSRPIFGKSSFFDTFFNLGVSVYNVLKLTVLGVFLTPLRGKGSRICEVFFKKYPLWKNPVGFSVFSEIFCVQKNPRPNPAMRMWNAWKMKFSVGSHCNNI